LGWRRESEKMENSWAELRTVSKDREERKNNNNNNNNSSKYKTSAT